MRTLTGILLFSTLVIVGLGQESPPESSEADVAVKIRKLALIEAKRLPDRDRDRIIQLFEHRAYPEGELQPRIRIVFQNLGYFNAQIDEPKLSPVRQTQSTKEVDVSVRVDEGVQYRLGEIRFEKASLFPSERMRKLFAVQRGELFNYTRIGKGLEQLRDLYATDGYVDLAVLPLTHIDEFHRTIDLSLELDEGKPYDFGRLVLDGLEPHAGAGKSLFASWKTG